MHDQDIDGRWKIRKKKGKTGRLPDMGCVSSGLKGEERPFSWA
jgi:hypothetical protein